MDHALPRTGNTLLVRPSRYLWVCLFKQVLQLYHQQQGHRTSWFPQLKHLTLDSDSFFIQRGSTEVLQLLQSLLLPLESLSLPRHTLGYTAWETLLKPSSTTAQHPINNPLTSLRHLSLIESGKILHQLLCTLPNLTTFHGNALHFSELRKDPRSWKSRSTLQDFQLFFVLEKPPHPLTTDYRSIRQQHEAIMDRLSEFQLLERLDIGTQFQVVKGVWRLQLSLSEGLSRLNPLKKLKSIGFRRTKQQLKQQDVEWMLTHWPRLERMEVNVMYMIVILTIKSRPYFERLV